MLRVLCLCSFTGYIDGQSSFSCWCCRVSSCKGVILRLFPYMCGCSMLFRVKFFLLLSLFNCLNLKISYLKSLSLFPLSYLGPLQHITRDWAQACFVYGPLANKTTGKKRCWGINIPQDYADLLFDWVGYAPSLQLFIFSDIHRFWLKQKG